MDNLRKVRSMDINHLFSAHRSYIEDYQARIDELLAHHSRRLDEVVNIVSKGESNMYDVSAKMTWDFGGGDFLKFPPQQKWFAAGEALAHAEHLYNTGVLNRREEGGVLYYRCA